MSMKKSDPVRHSGRRALGSAARAAVVAMTRVSAAVVAMVALAAPATSAEIYVLSGDSKLGNRNNPTYYGKIDIATGVYTQIANVNPSSTIEVRGLSYDSSRSAFYAYVSSGGSGDFLHTLDTAGTLSASPIGSGLNAYTAYSMAYNGANELYTYNYSNNDWVSVNTTTGASTTHGSIAGFTSSGPAGGRGVFFNGTYYTSLYGSGFSNGAFGSVDVSTTNWSFTSLSTASAYEFMNLATDGTTLYGVYADGSNARLYSIDANTGVYTLLTNVTGFSGTTYFYGAGMVPGASAVPGSGLAAIGSLGLAGLARRRRR